jgi:ribonucleoside-diphosphate reductase alpha chain
VRPPNRERLPDERKGITHRFVIKTQENEVVKGYVTVSFFSDGRIGEVFVKMDRQGSRVSGFVDAWAIAVSMLLQSGTSLEDICRKFRGAQFEPYGMTETETIRFARSPVDYIARWLEIKFISSAKKADRDVA